MVIAKITVTLQPYARLGEMASFCKTTSFRETEHMAAERVSFLRVRLSCVPQPNLTDFRAARSEDLVEI